MNMLEASDLAAMSAEDIRQHIQDVCFAKKEVAKLVVETDSAVGASVVARFERRLEAVLRNYGKIQVSGATDRDIVMAFVENRCAERFLREELAELASAKNDADALDTYHKLCETALKSKERSERTAR